MDGIVERFTSKIEPYDCWRSKQGNQLMKSNKFRKPIGSRRPISYALFFTNSAPSHPPSSVGSSPRAVGS